MATQDEFDRVLEQKRGWMERALEAEGEIARLRDFANWVDTWVSNPVTSYSVYALDGLFGMTRDKLAAMRRGER